MGRQVDPFMGVYREINVLINNLPTKEGEIRKIYKFPCALPHGKNACTVRRNLNCKTRGHVIVFVNQGIILMMAILGDSQPTTVMADFVSSGTR